MTTKISFSGLLERIEEQKSAALASPVHIICSTPARENLSELVCHFESIYGRDDIFKFSNLDSVKTTLTEAVHKTIIAYFYDSNQPFHRSYIDHDLLAPFQMMSIVDQYSIDCCKMTKREKQLLAEMTVIDLPSFVVFRMGHLVEVLHHDFSKDPAIAEQIKAYNEIHNVKPVLKNPVNAKIVSEREQERDEFEQRLREKKALEAKREYEEKIRDRIKIQKRIEDDKRARQEHMR